MVWELKCWTRMLEFRLQPAQVDVASRIGSWSFGYRRGQESPAIHANDFESFPAGGRFGIDQGSYGVAQPCAQHRLGREAV
jgi:hypothetical protein